MSESTALKENAPASIMPILLTAQQAARFIGYSKATFYRLLSAGKLPPAVSPTDHPRWRRADLEKWAERLKAYRPTNRRTRAAAEA